MHKCTAGDLAVIVYAYNTVNIGAIVRVLGLHPNQKQIQKCSNFCKDSANVLPRHTTC